MKIISNLHLKIWYRSLLKREASKQEDCIIQSETFKAIHKLPPIHSLWTSPHSLPCSDFCQTKHFIILCTFTFDTFLPQAGCILFAFEISSAPSSHDKTQCTSGYVWILSFPWEHYMKSMQTETLLWAFKWSVSCSVVSNSWQWTVTQ